MSENKEKDPTPTFLDDVLKKHFGDESRKVYENSPLLKYLKIKTKSISESSKSRASFGNLYAIFVLVEDYIKKGFNVDGDYSKYHGAQFSALFKRQRELPFGSKLQNHALNHRCNQEFKKFFHNIDDVPIIRDIKTRNYCINENLLIVLVNSKEFNIAETVIDIIQTYADLKTKMFESFFKSCKQLKNKFDEKKFRKFIKSGLMPDVDARVFEIVSFCILKNYYAINGKTLYKTGRTNANDGGIDFVMRPPGRFFQVSEVLDFKKYFLDIDKILRFPITFVIKFDEEPDSLRAIIKKQAKNEYDDKILRNYMGAIEEIISIPTLIGYLENVIKNKMSQNLLDDLMLYYKVEFNLA